MHNPSRHRAPASILSTATAPLLASQDEGLKRLRRKVESLEGLLGGHALAGRPDLAPRLQALLSKQVGAWGGLVLVLLPLPLLPCWAVHAARARCR